jgi:transposase
LELNPIYHGNVVGIDIHSKDVVEKAFNVLKNRLSLNRIRVHNSERMENKLFISFISLILTPYLHKTLKESNFNSAFTLEEIYQKIELLKKYVLIQIWYINI